MTDNNQSGPVDQEFNKAELDAFLAGLNAGSSSSFSTNPGEARAQLEADPMFTSIPRYLEEAMRMDSEGRDGDTPLARLLNHDDIFAMIFSISASPMHTEFEKARLIASIVLLAVQEYTDVV